MIEPEKNRIGFVILNKSRTRDQKLIGSESARAGNGESVFQAAAVLVEKVV